VISSLRRISLVTALSLLLPSTLLAEQTSRLTAPIDDTNRVTLSGTVHHLATATNDRGTVPDSTPLKRIQIQLKQSPAQQTAVRQLIDDLHNPTSPSFHQWLTPDQFGRQFGPSDADIATLSAWLAGKGFHVTKLNPGRQTLEFEGTAGQFRNAFHTEIHQYAVGGRMHYGNATDPQIPAALAPVFGGFSSLNNFPLKPPTRTTGKATYNPQTSMATPINTPQAPWTLGTPSTGYYFVVAPADFAIQYDTKPLLSAGNNGAGQTIAVINISNVDAYYFNLYRSLFGLPNIPLQVIVDGTDPGINGVNSPDGSGNGWASEAYLDIEMTSATAPGAQIDLVIASDTALSSGFNLAAEHAVYNNLAPVMSLSVESCEVYNGTAQNQFLNSLWQQAAAQGITVVVAASDSGSAGCDDFDTQAYATGGQAVNGWASTPYNIAVGGTDFYYSNYAVGGPALANQVATYWTETASNNTPVASLKSVIPEQPWNNSQYGLDAFNYYQYYGSTNIVGGSGGASNCGLTSSPCTGYPKPAWQTGTGVPADSVRDLPDVSLFAANGDNYSYYPLCDTDGDCQPVGSTGSVQIDGAGGTSASAPAFAGIMALINQKYGRQGQANYVLYPLATQYPAAFHDVTVGSNTMPCNIATTPSGEKPDNCISVTNPITVVDQNLGTGSVVEGAIGTGTTREYNAGIGYDLASGLGTIDANVMISDWNKVTFAGTTTTLTPSSTSFTHGTQITVSGAVTNSLSTKPTGSVALMTTSTLPSGAGLTDFPLSSGAFSSTIDYLPGGSYNIYGRYSGDTANASSTSTPVSITVTPETSATGLLVVGSNSSAYTILNSGSTVTYGEAINLEGLPAPTADLSAYLNCETNGGTCPTFTSPTGTITFSDGSTTLGSLGLNSVGEANYDYDAAIGSHTVKAAYSGDASYSASTSSSSTYTVVKDTPNLSAFSNNQYSPSGGPVVLSFIVENSIAANPFEAAPSGNLSFSGGPSSMTTSAALAPSVDPSTNASEGVATVTIPAGTAAGTYTITYSYPGDSNYNSTSATYTLVIGSSTLLVSTTTATATANTTSPSAGININVTVTGQTGKATPTGIVYLFAGGNYIGGAYIATATSTTATATIGVSSGSLITGTNVIAVEYIGDTNYQPSAATLTITNSLADFSLTAATNTVGMSANQSVPFGDAIIPTAINGFTGTIHLTCSATGGLTCSFGTNSITVGSPTTATTVNINASAVSTAGTYTVNVIGTDATGQYVHTVGIEVIVTAPVVASNSFILTSAGNITIASPGASGSTNITVAPTGTFTGTVALTCAVTSSPSGASDIPTCVLAPTSVTLAASTSSTSVLTINTTPQTHGSLRIQPTAWLAGMGGLLAAMATLGLFLLPSRRRRLPLLMLTLTAVLLLGNALGCGSNSAPAGSGGLTGGTSTGVYTVTVTGTSGNLTETVPVTVTVN
jgi:hypothetical protein